METNPNTPAGPAAGSANEPVIVAITAASGSIYGLRLIERIIATGTPAIAMISDTAADVIEHETSRSWESWQATLDPTAKQLRVASIHNLADPVASGSYLSAGMVIAPCSMGTQGRIAGGISSNLIERAADVCLKERRRLILLSRETPLNSIHIKNMLTLTEAGATIMPPVPSFYSRPQTVEEIVDGTVDRVMDHLGFRSSQQYRWSGFETAGDGT